MLLYPYMVFIYWYEWFIPTIIEFGRKLNFFKNLHLLQKYYQRRRHRCYDSRTSTKFWWFIERKGHTLRFHFLFVWFLKIHFDLNVWSLFLSIDDVNYSKFGKPLFKFIFRTKYMTSAFVYLRGLKIVQIGDIIRIGRCCGCSRN